MKLFIAVLLVLCVASAAIALPLIPVKNVKDFKEPEVTNGMCGGEKSLLVVTTDDLRMFIGENGKFVAIIFDARKIVLGSINKDTGDIKEGGSHDFQGSAEPHPCFHVYNSEA